jgi:hypothetical protein
MQLPYTKQSFFSEFPNSKEETLLQFIYHKNTPASVQPSIPKKFFRAADWRVQNATIPCHS